MDLNLQPSDWIQIAILLIGFITTVAILKTDIKHMDRRMSDHIESDKERFQEVHGDMREIRDRLSGGR